MLGDYGAGKTSLAIKMALYWFRLGHAVFSNASCLFGWHLDHELACRELDDALGLTEECLQESRGGRNVQHRLVSLPMQSVYSRLAGYEDTNDAERLADDPTMRVIVGRRGGPERPAASTNTMSRFETEVLTQDGNVEGLISS